MKLHKLKGQLMFVAALLLLGISLAISQSTTIQAQAPSLFSDEFENDLSLWVGKNGGAHSAKIVADPLRSGNQVVHFTEVTGGGDIFGTPMTTGAEQYVVQFEYLGTPPPAEGCIGYAFDTPGSHSWQFCKGYEQNIPDDGQWHSCQFEIPVNSTVRVMIEDRAGGGRIPGDAYFDNIQVVPGSGEFCQPIQQAETLTCDDTELYPNETIELDLIASGTDVYGLQATCAADASVAQVESASFGDFFPNIAAGSNQVSGNSWYGVGSQQNPAPAVSGSGIFATLSYTGVAPGTTSLTCEPLFSDRNGVAIDGEATACTITVLDYGHITGTVSYQGRLDHANIEVVATGSLTDMDLTDSAGNFDLDQLHAGDYALKADVALYLPACTTSEVNVTSGATVALPSTRLLGGDVNDNVETDLVINIADATLLAANLDPNNPPADTRADINADGVVNVQDWSILQGNYEVSGCQDW